MDPRATIEEVQEFVDGLTVLVESDGPDFRFVWTGGADRLKDLGFEPPLPVYQTRDDVPDWLLRRPGKSHVPEEYIIAERLYWKRKKPWVKKLGHAFEQTRLDSLALAQDVVGDYNELLRLSAAVAAALKRAGLSHNRLPSMWRKATGYLRDGASPPSRHPSPADSKWRRAFEEECARLLLFLGSGPFEQAVIQRAGSVLAARTKRLSRTSVLRAREVVMTAFLEEVAAHGDEACRPTLNSFWTWPYNVQNRDQAFLGVLAMRLFKNDSAKHERNVDPDFRNRKDFRFDHSPVDGPIDKGGLVVLNAKYQDPLLDIDAVLSTMTTVWQLHGGGKVRPVSLDLIKRRLGDVLKSDNRGRLRKLRSIEEQHGVAVADGHRYSVPARGERRLGRYVALAASVAVNREIELSRLDGEPVPFRSRIRR